MRLPPLNRTATWLTLAALLLGGAWTWRLCHSDDRVPFLPAHEGCPWIVYPKPPDTTPHLAVPLWAQFRRSFTLAAPPAQARISVRAFRQGSLRINGQVVDAIALREQGWKQVQIGDVAKYLKAGTNEISLTVSNLLGPPALWLVLKADGLVLRSDEQWQVSLVDAVWQGAQQASEPQAIRRGSPLYGRERVAESFHRIWPQLLVLLGLALAAVVGARSLKRGPWVLLGVILVSWGVLFANNLPQLPALLGFDRDGHLQYIDYILQHKALPLADEGWQMYQPPLFYLLSAAVLGLLDLSASADAALLTLRGFAALTGIAHVVLVFLCLRLLFPERPRLQVIGLLLAGFLPMNLCLSHHITNEGLAALCTTATIYFLLRLLRQQSGGTGLALGAGICLGLALLSKFSTVLAVPVLLATLAWPAWRGDTSFRRALGQVGLVLAAALIVCGWHYVRVWQRFGTPLIGNWDSRLAFAWWQDPGCHTGGWCWRFGQALVCPLYSGIAGLADGIYSTLWGDGLCSGSAIMHFRPQWNYDLMNAGYILSLVTTVVLAAGMCLALIRFLRQPTAEGLLLLGMVTAFAAGIALMTLRVASYAQVKAVYGLPAMFPLCALAAIGWGWLADKGRALRLLLTVGVAAWALTVYASFWIRSWDAFTWSAQGVGLSDDGRYAEAAEAFSRALQIDTNAVTARVQLAEALRRLGRTEEARQQLATALEQHPDRAEVQAEAGLMLSLDHQYPQAVQHLREALKLAPDHPTAYQQLAGCFSLQGQHSETIEACRQGLRIDPFNPTLHHTLALTWAATGDPTNAIAHLRLALALRPKWPEARSVLAVLLGEVGEPGLAAEQYEQLLRDKPDDPNVYCQYAGLLASQGKGREAAVQYRLALQLQPDQVQALNNLAWLLAASPADNLRDGAEAVRLAERACALSEQREPVFLGTLAAAYAEAGRFEDAIKAAEKARDTATAAGLKDVAERNSQLLSLYRAGKPVRDGAP